MRKALTLLAAGLGISATTYAQLPAASLAPNFTLKVLNGNTHTLYDYLNSGKTVFIDFSAAWCGPCWNYHNTHALRDLYQQHGPTGMSGVNASTTNDVMVLFVEGQSTNTTAQLYGPAANTGSYATTTQGNWVAGTTYPILDTPGAVMTAITNAWQINAFPTIYMVCRDRLVYDVGQLSAAQLYAVSQAGCPTYAPSATVDAKAVPYSGTEAFVCNAAPSVKFQNYSATSNITSATIKVLSGTTVVTSYNWTGNLPPYGVATANVPSFPANTFIPYKFEVTTTGDSYAANNTSQDSIFKVYAAANAQALPQSNDFEASTAFPIRYTPSADGAFFLFKSSGSTQVTGANGSVSRAIAIDYYSMPVGQTSDLLIGNFNTASSPAVSLLFDVAHGRYKDNSTPLSDDKLEVQVSTDCGTTWTTAWSKMGAALKTPNTRDSSIQFIPSAANQWRAEAVNLDAYKNGNMMVRFKATSDYGNLAWLDNVRLNTTPTGIEDAIASTGFTVSPNPATEQAVVNITLNQPTSVQLEVLDAMGRSVYRSESKKMSGAQAFTLPTKQFAAGVYHVVLRTDGGMLTQRLSVVK